MTHVSRVFSVCREETRDRVPQCLLNVLFKSYVRRSRISHTRRRPHCRGISCRQGKRRVATIVNSAAHVLWRSRDSSISPEGAGERSAVAREGARMRHASLGWGLATKGAPEFAVLTARGVRGRGARAGRRIQQILTLIAKIGWLDCLRGQVASRMWRQWAVEQWFQVVFRWVSPIGMRPCGG